LSTFAAPQTKCFGKRSSFNPQLKGGEAPTQVADTNDMRQSHVHKPSYTNCTTQSSEHFRTYSFWYLQGHQTFHSKYSVHKFM